VSNPSLSIRGAAISTIISYMITAFLNFIIVKKHTGLKLNISSIILKPVIASALMALILPHLYSILFSLTSSLKISTVLAVVLGGGFYMLLIIVLGGLTSEELKMLPIIKRIYQ
jgi:stage V sporulation protein B